MEKFITFSFEIDIFCYNDTNGNTSQETEPTVSPV